MKRIVIDLDGTLTKENPDLSYSDKQPWLDVIEKLRAYKAEGFLITILTARNMRSYEGNVGRINVHTLPGILSWLERHNVPYDEVVVGKPWCGEDGFYVDDRALRPDEFVNLTHTEIAQLFGKNKD